MTEETPGFEEEPDVPSGATSEDAASKAAGPDSGKESEPAAPAGDAQSSGQNSQETALTAQLDQVRTALSERTGDLQRLQAEYQNYRRRVERDRVQVKEVAIANLLSELLPTLDDIGRAREHGELVGGFKSVAESLETVAAKMGLQQFGKEGEPFDPTIHEALMHSYAPDITEDTCVAILQPGYRFGERTIRPARVAVAEPQPGAQSKDDAPDEDSGGPDEG
ncbi:nucleotide exchange factor GrpE [Streptomyces sp. NPDC090052]|uniref:nucleotide exchange factor GrpE n=1 Tax=unclassified Streptomyces TaxID=2593676 RepID=UPI002E1E22D0|nr:nucleotide exchange factor GrpE [Streptomyces sp. NBC_01020]WSX43635.1 nucleotide exchange factor GrpE [Streptomyces sp. NBC_00963]WSX68343.1 nucleotide exchange factor GrpE [Streptomyces sp. NBC_00932]